MPTITGMKGQRGRVFACSESLQSVNKLLAILRAEVHSRQLETGSRPMGFLAAL